MGDREKAPTLLWRLSLLHLTMELLALVARHLSLRQMPTEDDLLELLSRLAGQRPSLTASALGSEN